MLLGFLIRSESDWKSWRAAVSTKVGAADGGGKSSLVVHVHDREPVYGGVGGSMEGEREGAVDEVQSCDDMSGDEDDDGDGDGDAEGDGVVC